MNNLSRPIATGKAVASTPSLPALSARPTLPCPAPVAPSRAARRASAELRVAGLRACLAAAEQHLATLDAAEGM